MKTKYSDETLYRVAEHHHQGRGLVGHGSEKFEKFAPKENYLIHIAPSNGIYQLVQYLQPRISLRHANASQRFIFLETIPIQEEGNESDA